MCIDDIVCQRLRLKIFRVGLKQPLASYSKDIVLFRELWSFPPGNNLSKGCLYVLIFFCGAMTENQKVPPHRGHTGYEVPWLRAMWLGSLL